MSSHDAKGEATVKEHSLCKGFMLVALTAFTIGCHRESAGSGRNDAAYQQESFRPTGQASTSPFQMEPGPSTAAGPVGAQLQAPPSTKTPFPEIPRSRKNLDLESDPFGPTSEAEQAWLDAHGFPNARQWEIYTTASDHLLEQAANSGDDVARTMLDARHLSEDPEARTRLFAAGSEGNIFALSSLAAYMTGSRKGDLQVGYALSRVAEMRGDTRIAMARDIGMPRKLSDLEKMQAEAEAIRMNNQLDRIYREKHGSAPPPPVRRPVTELEN